MSLRLSLLLVAVPVVVTAQVPTRPDSTHPDSTRPRGDSLTRTPVQLQSITVTAAAAPTHAPMSVVRISPAVIAATQATSPYDLLRQVAGIEVHEQGQGPGFASDASIRGFSSDHSTDIALWIDGVPINEPVNGHAEGYNDWSLLMPQAVQSMEVLKGPTSAVYGNFAMAGVVNVLTRERMTGSEFAIDGGANGRADATFFTGLDKPNTGLVLGIRGMRDAGWRPNGEQHLGQFYGRLVQQLSSSTTLDVGTQLYAAGWDSPGFLSVDQFDAGAYDNVSERPMADSSATVSNAHHFAWCSRPTPRGAPPHMPRKEAGTSSSPFPVNRGRARDRAARPKRSINATGSVRRAP